MEESLGKRIAALRREKGLKQDELAEKMGVSPQAVSKWENDQTCPDINLLPKLAQLLGVTVDTLLTGHHPLPQPVVQVARKELKNMVLRIVVDSADGDKVKVNLPMPLVKAAIETGIEISRLSGNKSMKNIDLAQILHLVEQGAVGNLVEVDSGDGDIVRIFVE